MRALAPRTRWLVSDSLALAGRNLEHVRQIPEKLLDAVAAHASGHRRGPVVRAVPGARRALAIARLRSRTTE